MYLAAVQGFLSRAMIGEHVAPRGRSSLSCVIVKRHLARDYVLDYFKSPSMHA